MADDKALTFPCDFPIKVIGNASDEFESTVITIIRKHVPDIREGAIKSTHSKKGNYSAMTITIQATSQAQLDAIYSELSSNPHVLMAL